MSHKSSSRKQSSRVSIALQEQSREADKSGRCRRIVCDVLTLRVLGYVLKQPPSCIFILTLILISVCLPFIGLYIARQAVLPDLDAMQNWNSYIGKLGHNNYCFQVKPSSIDSTDIASLLPSYPPFNKTTVNANIKASINTSINTNRTLLTKCVELEFDVQRTVVMDDKEVKNIVLVANVSGEEIGTQIKCDGKRIDGEVFVHFWLAISPATLNATKWCSGGYCRVNGSVLITAPSCALPTRLPQVQEDFTFKTQVFDCKKSNRCPSTLCTHSFLDLTVPPDTEVSDIVMATECSESAVKVVNKHKFGAKVNDIIKINLSKSDMSVAAHHMYLAAVAVAALSLVFTLGILLTDRPTDPKPSVE